MPLDIEPDPKSINYDLYNIEEDAELSLLTPSNENINVVEEDVIEYLAGWVVRKYKKDFPDLLAKIQHEDHNQLQVPSWFSHLPFGGLTIPSSKWLEMVRVIEKILSRFLCKQSIFKSKNISSRLTQMIFRRLDCQDQGMVKVVKTYILQRIFIKIKFENQNRKKTIEKRKLFKKIIK